MGCLAGAVLPPFLVDVEDTMCFIVSSMVLVATGWPVVGSATAEGFEEFSVCGGTVRCTNFSNKGLWLSSFEFVASSAWAS